MNMRTADKLPPEIRCLKGFLTWKLTYKAGQKKPAKIPYYANGRLRAGDQGSPDDVASMVTLGEALSAAERDGCSGVGLAMLESWDITALDFDNCVVDRKVTSEDVANLCWGTYTEISPSGTGLRAFFKGYLPSRKDTQGQPFAVEVFGNNGYVTVTGDVADDCLRFGFESTVADLTPEVLQMYRERFGEPVSTALNVASDDRFMLSLKPTLGWTLAKGREILMACDAGCGRDEWVKAGMALHFEFNGSPEALALYNEWSSKAENYGGIKDVEGRWRSFGKGRSNTITGAWLNKWSRQSAARAAPETLDPNFMLADVAISQKLAERMKGSFLFNHGSVDWLRYHSGAWRKCQKGQEVEAAKLSASELRIGPFKNQEDAERQAKLAFRAMSSGGIAAALKLAQSDPHIAVSPSDFDTDNEVINCLNGVVDLRDGTLSEHDPALRFTKQCTVELTRSTPARWLKFLNEVSCGDAEWIDYTHRVCGYILTGLVREEVLFFMLGFGSNGKSVFANVLRRIMGNYIGVLPPECLMLAKGRDGEAATPAIATLPGVRLALMNEIESGSRLSAQTVKTLCSTEAMYARDVYSKSIHFVPTHKIVIRGNHKPIVTDDDDGIWRRIHLLPFDRKFAPDEVDMTLEGTLMSEASDIFGWMVDGAVEYFKRGIQPTGRVKAASISYRKESDILAEWLSDKTESGVGFEWSQFEAYHSYRMWCADQGTQPWAKKSFTRKLIERGFTTGQMTTGLRERIYKGFAYKNPVIDLFDLE